MAPDIRRAVRRLHEKYNGIRPINHQTFLPEMARVVMSLIRRAAYRLCSTAKWAIIALARALRVYVRYGVAGGPSLSSVIYRQVMACSIARNLGGIE